MGDAPQALEAERRYRDRLEARRTDETCASFAERWLRSGRDRSLLRASSTRMRPGASPLTSAPTPLGEVERLSARTWALGVPRNLSKIIGTMYEDARNVGIVESNPFSNLRLPVTEKTEEIHPPTLDEYRRLLDACAVLGGYGAEFRAAIQFAAWTGIRAGELHALQWDDIDGELSGVRRSRKPDGSIGSPKNGRERKIALLPPAQVLDDVPAGPTRSSSTRRAGSRSRRAITTTPGGRCEPRRESVQERSEHGLRDIRWHDLRHFCATQLLEMGLDHFAVSVQLGHEDGGALVMSRYGHPSKDAARERLLAAFRLSSIETGS